MKDPNPWKCDQCDTRKGKANHWWQAFGQEGAIPAFLIFPWNEEMAEESGRQHLCSESCVAKAASQWMGKIKEANNTQTKTTTFAAAVAEAITAFADTCYCGEILMADGRCPEGHE
jgi:hypothetical protein